MNYWWIVVKDPETGKTNLVFGSDKSEDDARLQGLETLGGLDFEIKKLPTRDRNSASAMMRGKKLSQGEGLHRATRRIGRNKTLNRLLSKRRRGNNYD